MRLDYVDGINFEIFVMDHCEGAKTTEDLEELAEDLHERIELAIQDYAMDEGIDY